MNSAQTAIATGPAGENGLCASRWYGRTMWTVTLAALALIVVMVLFWVAYLYVGVDIRVWPPIWPTSFNGDVLFVLDGMFAAGAVLLTAGIGRGRWLCKPSNRTWLIAAVAITVGLRVACVLLVPYKPSADFKVYHDWGVRMSREWIQGDGYRCLFPPGQTFALGVVYKLFGNLFGEVWRAGQMLNVFYAALTTIGIWYFARSLFGEFVGRLAALIHATLPSAVFGCMLLGAEVPETFWLVLALCVYAAWVDRSRLLVGALVCGLCLGIGALIRPTYLLLPIPIGLHMLLSWPQRRKALACAAVMGLGVAVAILPWTLRNYFVTGGFLLISSNGGGNLYSANNEEAQGAYTESAWQYVYDNAHGSDLELQRIGSERGKEWIRTHPARFIRLSLWKFVLFWTNDKEIAWWATEEHGLPMSDDLVGLSQAGSDGFYLLCMALAAVAMVRFRRYLIAHRGWMVITIIAMYFTAVHMVFESQTKYHFMLVPLVFILAALAYAPKEAILGSAGLPSDDTTGRPA